MRDPERIARIMQLFSVIWSDHPDMRFGQLVYNILVVLPEMKYKRYRQYHTHRIGGEDVQIPLNISIDPFHLEDDELEYYLQEIIHIGLINFIYKYQAA